MQVHLREPGSESDETIASGANAALESGITSLATMADTDPASTTRHRLSLSSCKLSEPNV